MPNDPNPNAALLAALHGINAHKRARDAPLLKALGYTEPEPESPNPEDEGAPEE